MNFIYDDDHAENSFGTISIVVQKLLSWIDYVILCRINQNNYKIHSYTCLPSSKISSFFLIQEDLEEDYPVYVGRSPQRRAQSLGAVLPSETDMPWYEPPMSRIGQVAQSQTKV